MMTDDARSPRANAWGRASIVVATAALVAAGVLFRLAIDGRDTPAATLQVTDVAASTIPVTIPPIDAVSTTQSAQSDSETTSGTEPSSAAAEPALPISPLAAQLGPRGSAVPRLAGERVLPTAITIGELELWAPVRAVGLDDGGELEVPDETEVGWYELGASPGETGATVLAAHVTWNDTVGPFHKLGKLEPGAEIRVGASDGSIRIYEVVERAMYRKNALPNWRIFRQTGPESLVLITCGGSFNPSIRRYRDNIVVYAVPVGSEPAPLAGSASPGARQASTPPG